MARYEKYVICWFGWTQFRDNVRLIRILALSKQQQHLYKPLYGHSRFDIEETDIWSPEIVRRATPDLLLTASCDSYDAIQCIDVARTMGIPSLYMMDGILEWRNQWENPKFSYGGNIAYNLPITTDKISCFGWASVRTFELWGCIGKCEVVGSPRFDHYLLDPIPAPQPHEGPKRLLIMTANTPGFIPEQLEKIKRSLADLNEALFSDREWEPIWRVRKGLDTELGLSDNYPELRGRSLRDALVLADAVITTPSTVLLEAMLAKRPAALIDYTNSPLYVNAAWVINCKEHIQSALNALKKPPTLRLLFQDEILHNNLECYTPALDRLILLIEKMVEIRRNNPNKPLKFPIHPLLSPDYEGHMLPTEFDFATLFPNHPIYRNTQVNDLQRKLAAAEKELKQLRSRLEQRSASYWLSLGIKKLARVIK